MRPFLMSRSKVRKAWLGRRRDAAGVGREMGPEHLFEICLLRL